MISGRPQLGEYASYAKADIDYVQGDDAVAVLRKQARDLIALFEPLGDAGVSGLRYAPGKWTLKEIIGHLCDDERIFAYRALCIARGDTNELPGFDENVYMALTNFESRPLENLLAEYRIVRDATIALFDSLTEDAWLRRGIVNGHEASVRGLAFHVAGHELHHLRVVREKYLA
jgi:hypothetical protein